MFLYDSDLQRVAFNDDSWANGDSRIVYTLQSGQTYYLEATSWSPGFGNYMLSFSTGTLAPTSSPWGEVSILPIY